MSRDRAARLKFGFCEEIDELLKGSTMLQRDAYQTGNYVVEADQFGRAVHSFDAKKDFRWSFAVINGDVERALAPIRTF